MVCSGINYDRVSLCVYLQEDRDIFVKNTVDIFLNSQFSKDVFCTEYSLNVSNDGISRKIYGA